MTIDDLQKFANYTEIPLAFELIDNPLYYGFRLVCFNRDKAVVESYLYHNKPVGINHELYSVPDQIGYDRQLLIECMEDGK